MYQYHNFIGTLEHKWVDLKVSAAIWCDILTYEIGAPSAGGFYN